MTNTEIIATINGLNTFIEVDRTIPVKLSYSITKNLKRLMEEYKIFEGERNKIFDGNYDNKTPEEKEMIDKKLAELLNINTDVNIVKINIKDIENCDNLTMKDMVILDFMIEE